MSGLESGNQPTFKIQEKNNTSNFEIKERVKKQISDESGRPALIEQREAAIEQFDSESLNIEKKDFASYFNLAQNFYENGAFEPALTAYLSALKHNEFDSPKLFEIYKNVGNIYLQLSDFEAAEEFYYKAYTLKPDSDVLLVNLGTLEVQRNNLEKALERYRYSVEVNPKNDNGWVGLSIVHREYGDLDLSWANIQKALDINSQNKTALELLVQWGVKDSRFEQTIQNLEVYLRLSVDKSWAYLNLGKVLFCCNRFERAEALLTEALKVYSGHKDLKKLYDLTRSVLFEQRNALSDSKR